MKLVLFTQNIFTLNFQENEKKNYLVLFALRIWWFVKNEKKNYETNDPNLLHFFTIKKYNKWKTLFSCKWEINTKIFKAKIHWSCNVFWLGDMHENWFLLWVNENFSVVFRAGRILLKRKLYQILLFWLRISEGSDKRVFFFQLSLLEIL